LGAGRAYIRSPDSLKRFRHRYLEFEKRAHMAVDLATGDLRGAIEWLHREQLPHWKVQLRRRHDKMKEAWRDYVAARYGDRRMGKPSCVDERKAYEKARRMKEQAEEKIRTIERWQMSLEREGEKLLPSIKTFGTMLETLTPKIVARLDHMMDRLEDYMRPARSKPPEGRAASGGEREGGGGEKEGGSHA